MECKHARFLLDLSPPRGGELEPSEAAALDRHLAQCPECAALAHQERQADDRLGEAMRAVPVPTGLRERIFKKLASERDLRQRRLLIRAVAVAASLLLAAGLGQWWLSTHKTEVDWALAPANQEDFARTPEGVQAYFRSRGVQMVAPDDFEYANLDSYGLADFQGVSVPHLLFIARFNGGNLRALARVYVLSDRQFDLQKADENPPPPGSYHYVLPVQKPAGNEHYRFVIILQKRQDLGLFLKHAV